MSANDRFPVAGPSIVYIATDGTEYYLDRIEDNPLSDREEAIARALLQLSIDRITRPTLGLARPAYEMRGA